MLIATLIEAMRAGWARRVGFRSENEIPGGYAYSNNFILKWRNAADTADIAGVGVDSNNNLTVGGAVTVPMRQTINLPIPLNAGSVDQCIFIAPYALTITAIKEIHATLGTNGSAVTLNLTKDVSGIVPGAGLTLQSGTFDMKGTNNTLQTATLSSTPTTLTLAAGDRIGANFTGTITALAGVLVSIEFTPAGNGDFAIFRQTEMGVADCAFYIANRPMQVSRIDYVHSTAGTNASAVNVQVVKDTSTDAPGAGTDTLTNNTNAGFNCKGTINVVQNGALTATAATLWLAAGDRLSVDFAGTTTALAGALVVVTFTALYPNTKDVTLVAKANLDCIDQTIWIADRSYRIIDARYINATAGTDGGGVNAELTVDALTAAPGAGLDVLSNNTAAGFNCKTTANTIEVATFNSSAAQLINSGNRLSVDFAGTVAVLAGVVITATLETI